MFWACSNVRTGQIQCDEYQFYRIECLFPSGFEGDEGYISVTLEFADIPPLM